MIDSLSEGLRAEKLNANFNINNTVGRWREGRERETEGASGDSSRSGLRGRRVPLRLRDAEEREKKRKEKKKEKRMLFN